MNDIPELQIVKPFLLHSKELENVHPILSFYLKNYAIDKTHQIFKKLKAEGKNVDNIMKLLQTWITEMEGIKSKLGTKIADKEANKREITDFIMQLFYKSDEEERNGVVTKSLIQNFQVCSRFLEMMTIFGPLPNDLNEKRIYAKAKAVEVAKKLKNPELYQKKDESNEMELEKEMEKINQKQDKLNSIERQSVFNQIPKILNKSNIYDEQSVNRIVDYVSQHQGVGKPTGTPGNTGITPIQQPQQSMPKELPAKTTQPAVNNQVTPNLDYAQTKPAGNVNKAAPLPINYGEKKDKVKKLCEYAISEMDFKRPKQAKEHLIAALEILQSLE